MGAGGVETRLRLILQLGCITAISSMDLKELPSIIKETWRKENVLS